jgi:hypothetical protein
LVEMMREEMRMRRGEVERESQARLVKIRNGIGLE